MEEQNLERAIGKLEGKMDMLISSMDSMSQAFANLEKGRLSTLEINFAKMQTELSDRARNTALTTSLWSSTIIGIIVIVIGALVLHFGFHI